MEQHRLQGPRIALLIDFDNVILGVDDPPGFDAELVMDALRSRGVVVLGRAYGDWYRHNRHRRKLMEQGIELVETPAFGPVIKNSADIRIALDAFEIGMTQSHISEFCLVSGDSDFLPLIKRLQLLGKSVVVIAGNKFTSALIRQNCNEYISYENLLAESVGAKEDASTLEGAFALLKRTINTMNERGQDARSSSVKQMMLQLNPVFSERSFGCHQFKQFLDKACDSGIIRLGRRDSNSGEYQVMMADDNAPNTVEQPETALREKPLISDLETSPVAPVKKSSTRSPKQKLEASKEKGAELEEPQELSIDDEIANNASTVPSSRRGRLKFSGRTWRSSGTSVKTDEDASETTSASSDDKSEEASSEPAAKTIEESESPAPEKKPTLKTESKEAKLQEAEPAKQTEKTEKIEVSAKDEVEEKPKTTRRRKATTSSSKTAKTASDETEKSPEDDKSAAKSDEKSPDKSEEKPAEPAPKKTKTTKKAAAKPAKKAEDGNGEEKPKKPVRRRTTAKKTAEAAPRKDEAPSE